MRIRSPRCDIAKVSRRSSSSTTHGFCSSRPPRIVLLLRGIFRWRASSSRSFRIFRCERRRKAWHRTEPDAAAVDAAAVHCSRHSQISNSHSSRELSLTSRYLRHSNPMTANTQHRKDSFRLAFYRAHFVNSVQGRSSSRSRFCSRRNDDCWCREHRNCHERCSSERADGFRRTHCPSAKRSYARRLAAVCCRLTSIRAVGSRRPDSRTHRSRWTSGRLSLGARRCHSSEQQCRHRSSRACSLREASCGRRNRRA